MGNKDKLPDAWEDDWETAADKSLKEEEPEPLQPAPLSKAERRAMHAETNRKLWESADSTDTFHYVEANNGVPLATNFKPQVKVLSRKPTPKMITRRDPITGLSQMSIEDDDEEEEQKKVQLSPDEIRAKQQKEREEKQRRYDEARAKIFGESNPSSGTSSPGNVTPPRSSESHGNQRGRGRGRGGLRNNDSRPLDNRRPTSQISTRELFDPGYSQKPGLAPQKRGGDSTSQPGRATQRDEDQAKQAIRAPRGPDGSGRGGFGFAKRGAKES